MTKVKVYNTKRIIDGFFNLRFMVSMIPFIGEEKQDKSFFCYNYWRVTKIPIDRLADYS